MSHLYALPPLQIKNFLREKAQVYGLKDYDDAVNKGHSHKELIAAELLLLEEECRVTGWDKITTMNIVRTV